MIWRSTISGVRACACVALLALGGCIKPPPRRPVVQTPTTQPDSLETITERINANAERMPDDVLLQSSDVAIEAGFIDEEGEEHRLVGYGSLRFVKPRYLYLDLKHGLANKMVEIGSDGERYWLWFAKRKTIWWGKHALLDRPGLRDMPIRPDQLIDALGVMPLPVASGALLGPWPQAPRALIPHTLHPQYKLSYFRQCEDGGLRLDRAYSVARVPPHLIERIVFGDAFGQISCEATLAGLEAGPVDVRDEVIQGPGPVMPRRLHLRLSKDNNFISLDISRPHLKRIPPRLRPPKWYRMQPPDDWQVIQVD